MPFGQYDRHERECVCEDPHDSSKKLWQCGGDLCKKLVNIRYFGKLEHKEEENNNEHS